MKRAFSVKSDGDCKQWLQRIHNVQTQQMTPEQRQRIQTRMELAQKTEESRRKVKAVKCHNKRSAALMSEALGQMTSSSAPTEYQAVQSRWNMAQEASDRRQQFQLAEVDEARTRSVAVVHDESESDEEGMAEAAQLVGAANISTMVRHADATDRSAEAEFQNLLKQLQREPNNDDEMAAKFVLYETYSQQVESIRNRLFALYQESRPNLPQSVANDMDKKLKKIDSTDAMGIPDDACEWFVYHMMKKAGNNNKVMASILEDYEKKLDFLANNAQEECPICLENFSEQLPAETLGCCHRVCSDCWAHWSSVMQGRPFCPLCRNDEFIEALASRAPSP
eukprot:gnl/MRDRNA2_/MRDRNA2_33748_c0_seq1.p1 gnl/MRDRNA2_/MRDRNA2_33748_c0~~gnl/MRDRNA2_/MRDRNA2_33748_c0_seq1.p1  ORF type:complete len:337 (+),score=93.04 gnl/MRDRNA2_/MRDRNA2_33748_c0_seq1:88-1098(+)